MKRHRERTAQIEQSPRYADRVKRIVNAPRVNEEGSSALIRSLRGEVKELRELLREARASSQKEGPSQVEMERLLARCERAEADNEKLRGELMLAEQRGRAAASKEAQPKPEELERAAKLEDSERRLKDQLRRLQEELSKQLEEEMKWRETQAELADTIARLKREMGERAEKLAAEREQRLADKDLGCVLVRCKNVAMRFLCRTFAAIAGGSGGEKNPRRSGRSGGSGWSGWNNEWVVVNKFLTA